MSGRIYGLGRKRFGGYAAPKRLFMPTRLCTDFPWTLLGQALVYFWRAPSRFYIIGLCVNVKRMNRRKQVIDNFSSF